MKHIVECHRATAFQNVEGFVPVEVSVNRNAWAFGQLLRTQAKIVGPLYGVDVDDDVAAVGAVGKDEYNLNNIIPVATLSIPIVNNIIESSRITLPAAIIGNPITIKSVDNVSDIAPLTICKTRNHTGGLLLVTVDVIDWIVS